ncbi:hypothetical protein C2E23DRAFT_142991 [Lenzites betulinus]|nr:hypothetical protein C2E23DRAFT_142991 [Lenzites betulinus]
MSDTNHLVSSESASGEEPVASMTAPYPFDEPSADVILRTSDNVDFHVRKAILEEASSMFATMFSLPQPPIGSEQGPQDSSPAIVPVSEPSEVMDPLLRMCYPAVPPTLSTLEEVAPLLKAADKYQMHDLLAVLTDKWAVLAEFNSLKAYMFAIIYDLEDPARVAAKHSLRDISLCEYRDTLLANISFGSISALVMYREDCARAADKAAKEFAREKKSFTVRTTCPVTTWTITSA